MTSLPRLAVDAILAISFAVSIALIPTANQSRQRLRLTTHSRRSRLKLRILFRRPYAAAISTASSRRSGFDSSLAIAIPQSAGVFIGYLILSLCQRDVEFNG